MTDAEAQYTKTERELLSVVNACEHYHTYLYSHSILVETYQKCLEIIALKNVIAATSCLQ